MVYDASDRYLVLFGGIESGTAYGDTWTFSANTWSKLSPSTSPSARTEAAMVYDAADGYVLLFGGDANGQTFGDTWTFSHGQWQQLNPAVSPSPRSNAGIAYDAADGYVLLFGGSSNSGHDYYGDTWTFKAGVWTQLSPSQSPSARGGQGLAYDATDHYVIMFGGSVNFYSSGAGLDDTWEFQGGSWTQLTPVSSPSVRDTYSMAYDPSTGSVVLFGGWVPAGACGNEVGDTWEYSGGEWTQPSLTTSPSARQGAAMDYDTADQAMVLFAGQFNPGAGPSTGCGTPAWLHDTWELRQAGSPTATLPSVANAAVDNFQTNISLAPGAPLYLYGLVTGGGYPSTGFTNGEYASGYDADGYLVAALAVTTNSTDSYTTQTFYPAIGGVSVNGFASYTSSYGANNSAAASSASTAFAITTPGSMVVVVADAGGEQSTTLSGIPGLSVDATNFNGGCNQGLPPVIWIGHAYPATGKYIVTEQTTQCAAGQDPNHAGDLLGVFVFTPATPPHQPADTPPTVFLMQPFYYGDCVSINGAMNPTTPGASLGPASWSWGDGSTTTSWFPATHTYTTTGTYLVQVTATDTNGLKATASTAVNITDTMALVPPQLAIFSPVIDGRTITVNGVANMNACQSGSLLPFSFNWGDGTATTGWFPQSHTYNSPGNFQVCVTATDSFGTSTTTCESATVQ
jgi:PKD domain/Galactose oxidase, central domain